MGKLMVLVMVSLILTACVTKTIKLTAQNTQYDGLVTQSVIFMHKEQQHQWVCYTELVQKNITGISCQNDTALQLFSGGVIDGDFKFAYPSRWLLSIQPETMLAYLKMSLFDDVKIASKQITVNKQAKTTTINDNKRKVILSIETL